MFAAPVYGAFTRLLSSNSSYFFPACYCEGILYMDRQSGRRTEAISSTVLLLETYYKLF